MGGLAHITITKTVRKSSANNFGLYLHITMAQRTTKNTNNPIIQYCVQTFVATEYLRYCENAIFEENCKYG